MRPSRAKPGMRVRLSSYEMYGDYREHRGQIGLVVHANSDRAEVTWADGRHSHVWDCDGVEFILIDDSRPKKIVVNTDKLDLLPKGTALMYKADAGHYLSEKQIGVSISLYERKKEWFV